MLPSIRWLLLAGLLCAVATAPAQPPKGKAPPSKEEEDPNAKPVKPPPRIEDDPKVEVPPAEGPGMNPPPGVLVVGVRSLPEFMSPAYARTDAEMMALDLLFEGLLRPAVDGAAGRVYEPALARELPRLVPRGREFTLTDAIWADPDQPELHPPVTAGDVQGTVAKIKSRKGQPGAEAADLIDAVSVRGTSQQCRVILTRGQIDPLAVMTFKLLPTARKDDPEFARKPVGTGPFVYAGRQVQGGRAYALFPANPAYGRRADRPYLPRLKAVWMVASRNPAADFKGGLIHFALTTHTGELTALKPPKPAADEPRQAGKLEVIISNLGKVDTLASRRVYFLAVNHKVPALGEGERGRDLRRLLAYAIQRDAILTACFRAGFAEHHQPLTGPVPPNTWPCSDIAGRLDDAALAGALAGKRKGAKLTLDLKYPAGDPSVAEACKLMAQQVADLNCGVTLVPKAVDPADYYKRVFLERDFQLAYWHHDYPDEWFSQTGLFDPAAQEFQGRNFMRYDPPAAVQQLLARSQDRRDFGEVRTAMRQWHAAFAQEMPIIPLWHLDTHALFATGLTTVPPAGLLDPLAPFTHVEQWAIK